MNNDVKIKVRLSSENSEIKAASQGCVMLSEYEVNYKIIEGVDTPLSAFFTLL